MPGTLDVVPSASTLASHVAEGVRRRVQDLLSRAGIELDGGRPFDPRIHRASALTHLLADGTLGAGEAYVDGDWDCDALDEFAARLLAPGALCQFASHSAFARAAGVLKPLLHIDGQTRVRAKHNIVAHYDVGNDLYAAMLGRSMAYSCGYWAKAATLDEAQDAKHDLICRKLGIEPGMRVLDIGCGWGGFATFAAERYRASVVGITISPAQAALARRRSAGLPIEIREVDYRDVTGRYDRVVSVGMFEHVGPRHYRTFFEAVARLLEPDGLALLHTIGCLESLETTDPWIERYIFPHSVLPSAAQVTAAFEGLFVLEDWHNFGADYDRTLMAWHANIEAAWPSLGDRYDERFRRLWRYYLLTCAGAFRARHNQVWQLVLSPSGVPGGYLFHRR